MTPSSLKRGLYWALTALQVSPERLDTGDTASSLRLTPKKSLADVPVEFSSRMDDLENVQPTFSRQEVADHCCSQSCWMVINNKVYDVTRFLRLHPGGEDIMLEYGGHDATSAFIDKGHSSDAFHMLAEYCIGTVIQADWFPEKKFT